MLPLITKAMPKYLLNANRANVVGDMLRGRVRVLGRGAKVHICIPPIYVGKEFPKKAVDLLLILRFLAISTRNP